MQNFVLGLLPVCSRQPKEDRFVFAWEGSVMSVCICVVCVHEAVFATYDPGFVCAVEESYVAEAGDEPGPPGDISVNEGSDTSFALVGWGR